MMFQINDRGQWHNRYCGPAAVSILTGVHTNEVARLVKERFRSWDSRVRGMYVNELKDALEYFGRRVVDQHHFFTGSRGDASRHTATVKQYVNKLLPKPGIAYVIVAGNHYQTYLPFLGEIRDNWGSWPVEGFPYGKRKFGSAILVDCTRWTNDRRFLYGVER